MKTVAQRWDEFRAGVIPKGAGPTQVQEMRRAFYAGFSSSLQAGIEMADESKDNDDVGATMIQKLHVECRAFAQAVASGRA